jgi:hypothetical protein
MMADLPVPMHLLIRMFLASIAAIPIVAFGCATEEIPPYGEPGKVVGGSGEPGATSGGNCTPDAGCAVSFQMDVFPILEDVAKCSEATACHGGNAGDIQLTGGNPKTLREGLLAAKLGGVDPYVVPCDASASKMPCNMRIETGQTNTFPKCGALMPKVDPDDAVDDVRLNQDQINTIAEWIQCGAPDN